MSENSNQNGHAAFSWGDVLAELDTKGPERHAVECPELGRQADGSPRRVWVRPLTHNEELRITNRTLDVRKQAINHSLADQLRFLWGVVEPPITPAQYEDLKNTPAASAALQRILTKISELSGVILPGSEATDAQGNPTDDPVLAQEGHFRAPS